MACVYKITVDDKELSFDSKEALVKHIRTHELYDTIVRNEKPEMTTKSLANALLQSTFGQPQYSVGQFKGFQKDLLETFVKMEEQSQYFYKIGAAIALTKGLGKDFSTIDKIKKNLQDVNIGGEQNNSVPFDVRYLITGNKEYSSAKDEYSHKLTANNLKLMREIDTLSKTMFMERTPSFQNVADKTVANLKNSMANNTDKVNSLKNDLAAFSQIASYKKWLELNDKRTSTLRNTLIYDSEGGLETIVDIAKKATNLAPENAFLKFILPVSTTVKLSKKKQKNIINRDLTNTIEGKTRGRIEPDMVANLMDSFTELYQNPQTQFYAKALFDYLVVKDGLMFKNKSFIRMLPTFIFDDMSKATDLATTLMAANSIDEFKGVLKKLNGLVIYNKLGESVEYFSEKERVDFRDSLKAGDVKKVKDALYKKVFGMDYQALYDRFEKIYATDVANQYDLDLIQGQIRGKKGAKTPDSFVAVKADDGETYFHVNLFTEQFKSLAKGSEERSAQFVQTLKELDSAGFEVVKAGTAKEDADEEDNKLYIKMKKFIRVRGKNKQYLLYELVQVYRDGKAYTGSQGFTATNEMVPRGTSGVYKQVQAVGSANTSGVADLGVRPTKEQLEKLLADKIKKEEPVDNMPPPMVGTTTAIAPVNAAPSSSQPTTPNPVPPSTGGVSFGGFQILPSDESGMGDVPFGFFSKDEVDNTPCD